MRLESINLEGFKSFVDPTAVKLPSNLVGVVGPNGCGKSNIIDAVRWVMGERSVKNLRGESMADVIFSGSSTRKPVGRASVELIFDNRDGSLGGEYAAYAEIAIRREVVRDGQSNYYLNGTHCRRRDIIDIFLGTGLGPSSYAIIQQGTVSRLIEAKPEEMRIFLEEAAGISKYKERRRETELRIRNTRENLERLNDLCEELDKQLAHLERQAEAAERYQVLKQEHETVSMQLRAIRWRNFDNAYQQLQIEIRDKEVALTALESQQQTVETAVEKQREQQFSDNEILNTIQDQFYAAGNAINRLEQEILHRRERHQQLQTDLTQTQQQWKDAEEVCLSDELSQQELLSTLENIAPQLALWQEKAAISQQTLNEIEEKLHDWQHRWDSFNHQAATTAQTAQVEQTRIQHLEQHIENLAERIKRFQDELAQLAWDDLQQEVVVHTQQLEAYDDLKANALQQAQNLIQSLSQCKESNQQVILALNNKRSELQSLKGQRASLETLQQAALGKNDKVLNQWLSEHHLTTQARLAQQLKVTTGWERAVETVLADYLQAICVEDLAAFEQACTSLQQGHISLLSAGTIANEAPQPDSLLSKLTATRVPSFLAAIYVADNLNQALSRLRNLQAHESVITADGIWVGQNWLRIYRGDDPQAGIIKREQALQELSAQIEQLQQVIEQLEEEQQQGEQQFDDLMAEKEAAQQQQSTITTQIAELQSQLRVKNDRIQQLSRRQFQLSKESTELKQQLAQNEVTLQESRNNWQIALEKMQNDADERSVLLADREQYREQVTTVRQQAQQDKQRADELSLQAQTLHARQESLLQNLQRAQKQLADLTLRQQNLHENMQLTIAPLDDFREDLEIALQERLELESKLTSARKQVDELTESLRQLEQERQQLQQQHTQLRSGLEQQRLSWQELKVKRQTIEEQVIEAGFLLNDVIQALPEVTDERSWEEQLEQLERKIQRLGAINLAAIEECKAQSERKVYLATQHADLVEALATLEGAINKIDRETKARFKITFDRVNKSFGELFPKLFGGGSAYLELTEDDLLDSGVSVMAHPPGKRNSSIHLLSGGEKALTAVALVFAIFQLNPAPFCMLDEVDAPLDDANIGRFSALVKEMSEKIQFIFISHNKPTMEIAKQLIGITMHEPGVSRVVAVDIDAAVELAAV